MRRNCPPRLLLAAVLLAGTVALTGAATAQTTILIYDGDEISLSAGEGQVIRGETSLEPGSTVLVRIRSENPESPFLSRPEAEVGEDGEFSVSVDLSDVDPGSAATVSVHHDGEELAAADAHVGECDGGCKPIATIDQQGERLSLESGPGQEISGETSLEAGSSVTVRIESEEPSEPFLVAKEVIVTRGGSFSTHLDLSNIDPPTRLRIAVLHDGEQLNETTGEVVACDGACEPATTDTPTPRPSIDPSELDFESVTEVETTETAYIPVALGEADAATLVIGSSDVNYVIAATVRDGNGDNLAGVYFDAAAAGTDERTLSAADEGDKLTVVDQEPDLGNSIDPATYDVQLYRGDSATGDPEAVGALIVLESGPAQDNVALEKSVLRTERGGNVTVPIRLGGADAATIAIGDVPDSYGVNATVRDGDGDGRVALSVRTANAGTDRPTLATVSANDTVTIREPEPALDGPLPATEYDVRLYRGPEATDDPVGIGSLSVAPEGEGGDGTPALDDSGGGDRNVDFGGLGALAAGAAFAVVGVGLLLGLFRS